MIRLLGVALPGQFDSVFAKIPRQVAHLPRTAVDMMRLLNCFGVSLCILYWTWFGRFDSVFSAVIMMDMLLLQLYQFLRVSFRH